MAETKESYTLMADDVPALVRSLNFMLARIADRLDALEGHRDRPTLYQNPKLQESEASEMLTTDADKIMESLPQDEVSTLILLGVTATAAEINRVADGILATAAEVNKVADGITATAAEINTACDGVLATAAEINTACDGILATAAEINTACDGVLATAAEINTACDGILATAAEINTVADGDTAKNNHTH